jgi:hypothetical protein
MIPVQYIQNINYCAEAPEDKFMRNWMDIRDSKKSRCLAYQLTFVYSTPYVILWSPSDKHLCTYWRTTFHYLP